MKKVTATKEYLELCEKYKNIYGEKTVVLGQIGAFYEVYGLQDKKKNILPLTPLDEYSKITELSITSKNTYHNGLKILFCGFQKQFVERFLKKITGAGYTVVIWDQEEQKPNSARKISGIYSPGTSFLNDSKNLSNNIVCIWLNVYKEFITKKQYISIGISNVDNYTGKVTILEIEKEFYHNPTTYDEVEHFISIYQPSETIIIYNIDDDTVNDFVQYTNINSVLIRKINLKADESLSEDARNCEKQVYQDTILSRFYDNFERSIHEDYYKYPIGSQAYCFLLNYIYIHNKALVRKIKEPVFEKEKDRLVLANHSLKQLNIITELNEDMNRKNQSVYSLLNKCLTSSGKRRLNYHLLNPSTNIKNLQESYDIIEHSIANRFPEKVNHILYLMKDIEKLNRKLMIKKITPLDFSFLYETIGYVKQLFIDNEEDPVVQTYLTKNIKTNILNSSDKLLGFLEHVLNIDICRNIDNLYFERLVDKSFDYFNFINKGVSEKLDEKIKLSIEARDELEAIVDFLSSIMIKLENKSKTPEYIKPYETKEGYHHLLMTMKRATTLKKQIITLGLKQETLTTKKGVDFIFDCTLLDVNKYTKTQYEIVHPAIKKLCLGLRDDKENFLSILTLVYDKFMEEMITYEPHINFLVEYVVNLDLLQNKCQVAKLYNCVKPVIRESGKSFVEAKQIRHILIEQLNQKETYVPNDLSLGTTQGILLYGVNAVGKTSLIKALGISVIMAQIGFYVPCESFEYYPYDYIFTRILGNDNIFKGLSTFEVEMSELRTILKYSTPNSLVLGDELCSGTETDSALSIFVSGMQKLYKTNSSFIFATHFHELNHYSELKEMPNIIMKHMSISYDEETNALVYDRILKDGSGESIYGLEVCKSLKMPTDFLRDAEVILNKYSGKSRDTLSLKKSRYNPNKLKDICEFCKEKMGDEVHHLSPQKDANENDYVDSYHKNHSGNLISVCEKCHDIIHSHELMGKFKKTTKGYKLEFKKIEA